MSADNRNTVQNVTVRLRLIGRGLLGTEWRTHGFGDQAIHDACAVAGYFAFANRIIAGLGVELEPEHRLGPDSKS